MVQLALAVLLAAAGAPPETMRKDQQEVIRSALAFEQGRHGGTRVSETCLTARTSGPTFQGYDRKLAAKYEASLAAGAMLAGTTLPTAMVTAAERVAIDLAYRSLREAGQVTREANGVRRPHERGAGPPIAEDVVRAYNGLNDPRSCKTTASVTTPAVRADVAFVDDGEICGGLCGHGETCGLVRRQGEWVVVTVSGMWVS